MTSESYQEEHSSSFNLQDSHPANFNTLVIRTPSTSQFNFQNAQWSHQQRNIQYPLLQLNLVQNRLIDQIPNQLIQINQERQRTPSQQKKYKNNISRKKTDIKKKIYIQNLQKQNEEKTSSIEWMGKKLKLMGEELNEFAKKNYQLVKKNNQLVEMVQKDSQMKQLNNKLNEQRQSHLRLQYEYNNLEKTTQRMKEQQSSLENKYNKRQLQFTLLIQKDKEQQKEIAKKKQQLEDMKKKESQKNKYITSLAQANRFQQKKIEQLKEQLGNSQNPYKRNRPCEQNYQHIRVQTFKQQLVKIICNKFQFLLRYPNRYNSRYQRQDVINGYVKEFIIENRELWKKINPKILLL